MRKAFVMQVYEQYYDEYETRHNELWPEMEKAIFEHGAIHYSIYLLKETGQLFGFLQLEDENRWDELANTLICKKWWAYMSQIMETNEDSSPKSTDLQCVFTLTKEVSTNVN